MRLQNIYDIDSRTFMFKFTKPGSEKVLVIIESGARIHITQFDREDSVAQPSFFVSKMRKFLRERRITGLKQLGADRVVSFEFHHEASVEQSYQLIVELYSSGNVILVNGLGEVLLLLRVVPTVNLTLGSQYKISPQALFSTKDIMERMKRKSESVRNFLKDALNVPAAMIDALFTGVTIKCNQLTAEAVESISNSLDKLKTELESGKPNEGFLVTCSDGTLEEYHPLPIVPKDGKWLIKTESFNAAVDQFYSQLEGQKAEQKLKQQESEAQRKITAIHTEQQGRIKGLQFAIDEYLSKAHAVEANPKDVESVSSVVKVALENGLSWSDFGTLIEDEKRKGRPTAMLIEKLKLEEGFITVKLSDLAVDINYRISVHANANRYYLLRKNAMDKLARTEAAFELALKSAEAKIRMDLKQARSKFSRQQMAARRKSLWFEKFLWFVSSEGYLVLAGRDQQQNEILVKRYLKKGDVYVHADIHGAASLIIKNHRFPELSVPLHRTLIEAGNMSLVHSRAWDAKIVTSAWWVHAEQVSKTAQSGEYLSTGSFVIRGKKNFLPPSQLTCAFGIMFIVDEECRQERRLQRMAIQKEDNNQETSEEMTKLFERYLGSSAFEQDETIIDTSQVSIDDKPEKKAKNSEKEHTVSAQQTKKTIEKNGQVRGKKGKMKKMATKYADQDEEEREARMELLGSIPKEPKRKTEAKSSMPRKDKIEKSEKTVKKEEPKEALNEDIEEPEAGEDELAIIDGLTGSPTLEELAHVINVVPVCGPVSALNKYYFKIRMTPGPLKRGKAAQQAIQSIAGNVKDGLPSDAGEDLHKRIQELVKAVPEPDLNAAMIAKVRLAIGSIEKSNKTGKKK